MMNKSIFIIAEVAQAHDGSLGILHSYIDAVAKLGVDAIKFQTHIADAESSEYEPFRVNFSYEDKTRYDYWKRMEFTLDQWKEIKMHCDEANIEFISSPFSMQAVELLEQIGIETYKIASGEVGNLLMIDRIISTGKKVIISSGLSDFKELDKLSVHLENSQVDWGLLQCTTAYPTPPEKIGLNVMQEYANRYNVPVGLSDHSGDIYACLAAVALGASLLEAHVTFHKSMFGPDSSSSLDMDQFGKLVSGVRFLEQTLNNPVKKDTQALEKLRKTFGKSLAINKDLDEGAIITIEDLETKKPAGYGVSPSMYKDVVGRKTNRIMKMNEFLNFGDLI
ncbi:N-acetylneuraminate synthase family protein [Ekhidna sp.]|uniref:N-acetylneuraminate synthase family protein n=1 Tax=Ekhidna sp. TaxID=2608089 RepID=UPI003CCBC682